ncbi:hypothetical protein ACFQJ7_04730 [Halovenus rubra]|uniref:Uncharacterized protein n=2 Tax=Halovenus rubra TaxID=869890 RepID=A0ACC7DXT4_9EURY|nr:hypothetical protein [Halovenus rubra]
MDGYRLLPRLGYAGLYFVTAGMLVASSLGTFLGLFAFGSIVWWPTLLFLVVVFALELHRFYVLNLA